MTDDSKWTLIGIDKLDKFFNKKKVPQTDQTRIINSVNSIEDNPYPSNSKKLKGTDNGYRIRIGNIRILYDIDKKEREIRIVDVGRRENVYKKEDREIEESLLISKVSKSDLRIPTTPEILVQAVVQGGAERQNTPKLKKKL